MAHFIDSIEKAPRGFRNDAVNLDVIASVRKGEAVANIDKDGRRIRRLSEIAGSTEVRGPAVFFKGITERADSEWVFQNEEQRDIAWRRVMSARTA
jgi:hypothetical protein